MMDNELSPTADWICRETGLLPSQYNTSAIDHLVQYVISLLKSHMQQSGTTNTVYCGKAARKKEAISSTTIRNISELCVSAMIQPERVLPLIECLLMCKFHSNDLSPSFLDKVTHLRRRNRGALTLNHEATLALWTCHLPSFKQELLDLMESLQNPPGSHEQSEEEKIESSLASINLPKSCLERVQLLLYTEDFLQSQVESSQTHCIELTVRVFNRMLLHQYNKMVIKPSKCPVLTLS